MHRYSVFQIVNSDRILNNIAQDIENKFSKKFNQQDSVYIFIMDSRTEIKRFGYAKNEEKEIIVIWILQTEVFVRYNGERKGC